jgi:ammonium transporter, Amt family
MIAGLIGITPAAGFVTPSSAFAIGIASGVSCFFGIQIKTIFDFDDSLDAFGLHAIAGIVGGLLTGLFAHTATEEGLFHGAITQFGLQIYGIILTVVWSVFGTAFVLLIVDTFFGLRVSEKEETVGLDLAQHGSTLTAQASKASRRLGIEDQNICCQLHCPCFVLTLRNQNKNSNNNST